MERLKAQRLPLELGQLLQGAVVIGVVHDVADDPDHAAIPPHLRRMVGADPRGAHRLDMPAPIVAEFEGQQRLALALAQARRLPAYYRVGPIVAFRVGQRAEVLVGAPRKLGERRCRRRLDRAAAQEPTRDPVDEDNPFAAVTHQRDRPIDREDLRQLSTCAPIVAPIVGLVRRRARVFAGLQGVSLWRRRWLLDRPQRSMVSLRPRGGLRVVSTGRHHESDADQCAQPHPRPERTRSAPHRGLGLLACRQVYNRLRVSHSRGQGLKRRGGRSTTSTARPERADCG